MLAFVQILRPGYPCVFGGFTSNVDMKSGSPAFGTPDFIALALSCGWQARIVESLPAPGAELRDAFGKAGPVLLRFDENTVPPGE